ncbi:hypothetical protein ACQR16_23295 [Bradyrhizobium oligotrophicum]|uniref:hypothetical protein n=1 Tax=Bradyrhizobium oligotrophicum TaxID=44255 RepID=UPI003EBF4443
MSIAAKLPQGTAAWFEMVGKLVCEAASRANLPPNLNWSLVERYRDGSPLQNGRVQGIRIDVKNGRPSFQIGVSKDERGDVTIEISRKAARELNLLYATDPAYAVVRDAALSLGEIRIDGDLAPVVDWLGVAHAPIVDRTC